MKAPKRLEPLIEEGIVDEVIRPLLSGKEASCFVVLAGGEERVAKVYKDAAQRSFKSRAEYLEGRAVRRSRDRRAMAKGSAFGKKQLEEAWQNAEVEALYRLHAAGVRVPKPYCFFEGVLLMDLIEDGGGHPAARLGELDFDRKAAVEVHAELMRQVALMLCASTVHGDLSEFNVLLPPEGPTVIDLPQAVDAAHNPNAKRLFLRDVENLTRFFASYAPELHRTSYGHEIWGLYERSELHPDTELKGHVAGSRTASPDGLAQEEQPDATIVRRRSVVIIEPTRSNGRSRPRGGALAGGTGAAPSSRRPEERRGANGARPAGNNGQDSQAPSSNRRRRRRKRRPNDSAAAAG